MTTMIGSSSKEYFPTGLRKDCILGVFQGLDEILIVGVGGLRPKDMVIMSVFHSLTVWLIAFMSG